MDSLPELATRKNLVDDLNSKFKSMFIDMDLALSQNVHSPRVIRRLQKSSDLHEEFEFSMSNMAIKDDIHGPAMEVASADKLFFRGQLLPLQLQASKHYANSALPQESFPLNKLEEPSKKCASAKGLLMVCDDDESFPMQCISQEACNLVKYHAHEESFAPDFSLRNGPDRSSRLDSIFDLLKNDSRSSSFRSHQSSYWSSGEKDSRDSSSSSRCSNGSCQDSWLQGADRKAPNISVLKAEYANINASAENKYDMGVNIRNADPNQCRIRSTKPPIPTTENSRKWSWKGFFTGLMKASKLWADGERGDEGQVPSKGGVQTRPVFTFKELPCALGEPVSYRRSVGHDWEWQTNTYQFVSNEGSSKTGRLSLGRDDYEEQQFGTTTVFCLKSGGRQEASFTGSAGECGKREKGKMQGNTSWNAKESWNRCVSKVKKGTRFTASASKGEQKQISPMQMSNKSNAMLIMSDLEDKRDGYREMKAKSLSSTPFAKSPVRRPEYYSNNSSNGGHGSLFYSMQVDASLANTSSSSASSMKNISKKVGFASCPASMRSSPHHSGLLAVVNKATPDLHIAIQGAIAHCKQSQASNPP